MNEHQAFYSVIQYLPVPERFEFLNIGVVLFLPKHGGVDIKIDPDFRRIRKLFGEVDRHKIKWMSDSLASRLRSEFASGWREETLARFAAMRSGAIQMSPPLPILLRNDPKEVLERLFDELVGRSSVERRSPRAATAFKRRLLSAGILDLVDQSPAPVELPEGFTIKAPFAYQNGAYNLIDPIRLEGTPEDALKNASSKAIEGRWLWRHSAHSKRLVVVGDLSGQPAKFSTSLHEVMRENDVKFYDLDEVDPLLDDIRSHSRGSDAAAVHA